MKYFSIILFLLALTSLSAQDASAIAKFDAVTLDLGKVTQGDKVSGVFSFTNITDEAIQIDLVSTCECTDAKWTRGPIAPGKKGEINFVFDSAKKEENEPVDVDIIFLNVNPKTDNPYAAYLQYTYDLVK